MIQKYRISYDLSTAVKFFGLTKEELILGVCGFLSFMYFPNKIFGGILGGFCVLALLMWRRLQKCFPGLSMKLFLWWHLGLCWGRSYFPPSTTREIG